VKLLVVLFVPIILFSCDKREIKPVISASEYLANERQLKTGLVDYGHHTINPEYVDFIANNYDYIVSGEQDMDFPFYKGKNPDIQIYAYWNSILFSPTQVAPALESAYLHYGAANAANPLQRIGRIFDSDFYYVMDLGSTSWQEYSLNNINKIVANGFDGVHLDDVYAHLMHEAHFNAEAPLLIGQPDNFTSFSTLPAWYNAQESHDDFKNYIAYINNNGIGNTIYNGINDHAENLQPISASLHPKDYLRVADGSVQEGFVYNGLWATNPEDGFFGDEYWEAIVQTLIDTPPDKLNGVVSYGDVNFFRARIFAFASYLLGYSPNKETTYYYTPNEFTLTYLPEWNLKIGSPLVNKVSVYDYKVGNYYQRAFENGMVLVNPYGSATGSINLGSDYQKLIITTDIDVKVINGNSKVAIGELNQLQLETVTSVEIAPYSAVILIK
jgi:putative glycosyl hydrolase-like family 15 (GHL15) protein